MPQVSPPEQVHVAVTTFVCVRPKDATTELAPKDFEERYIPAVHTELKRRLAPIAGKVANRPDQSDSESQCELVHSPI